MDRCVTLLLLRGAPSRVVQSSRGVLPAGACSRPGRAPDRVVLPQQSSALAYKCKCAYKCAFSYRFPPAGHHAVGLHTSTCKPSAHKSAKAHSRIVSPRGTSVGLHTSECVQGKSAFSSRFPPAEHHAVRLHTSTCEPGAHKYAKARYGAVYPRRTSRGRLTYRSMCGT